MCLLDQEKDLGDFDGDGEGDKNRCSRRTHSCIEVVVSKVVATSPSYLAIKLLFSSFLISSASAPTATTTAAAKSKQRNWLLLMRLHYRSERIDCKQWNAKGDANAMCSPFNRQRKTEVRPTNRRRRHCFDDLASSFIFNRTKHNFCFQIDCR